MLSHLNINIPVFEIRPKPSLGCLTCTEPKKIEFKNINNTSAEADTYVFAVVKALVPKRYHESSP